MAVRGIGHANLLAPAAMIERLRRFYIEVVGLTEGSRPQFRSGSHAKSNGAFNHLAFACDDLTATRARLDAARIPYEVDVVDEREQVQLFLTDPAGMGVELTFRTAVTRRVSGK